MQKNIKTAIIIINYNLKEMTENLCKKIYTYSKCNFKLLIVETGSRKENLTSYPTLWLPDGVRACRGFKKGWEYLKWMEQYNNEYYDSIFCCVNDAIFNNEDFLSPLANFIRDNEDCGMIHPYFTENSHSNQLKKEDGSARKESFCEFVAPMFSRKAIELNLFNEDFFYFWGVDYEIPYILHKNNLNVYVSNEVCVEHHPSTTTLSGKDNLFKTKQDQFNISRKNMIEGLEKKYGVNWGDLFLNQIPKDVNSNSFLDWVTNNGDYKFNGNC
jgi:hypothetical protein